MQIAATFVSALLFGLGLCVSGLANPAKVQNFLDITGSWDPSLVLTMGAAVLVTGVGYRIAFARGMPLFGKAFLVPPPGTINARLIGGATIFGIGWGLAGFCPGPAIVAVALGASSAFLFVAAMLVGMALARKFTAERAAPAIPVAR
jgi:uncharacterized protein